MRLKKITLKNIYNKNTKGDKIELPLINEQGKKTRNSKVVSFCIEETPKKKYKSNSKSKKKIREEIRRTKSESPKNKISKTTIANVCIFQKSNLRPITPPDEEEKKKLNNYYKIMNKIRNLTKINAEEKSIKNILSSGGFNTIEQINLSFKKLKKNKFRKKKIIFGKKFDMQKRHFTGILEYRKNLENSSLSTKNILETYIEENKKYIKKSNSVVNEILKNHNLNKKDKLKKLYCINEGYAKSLKKIKRNNSLPFLNDFRIEDYQHMLIEVASTKVRDEYVYDLQKNLKKFNVDILKMASVKGRFTTMAENLKNNIPFFLINKLKKLDEDRDAKKIEYNNYIKGRYKRLTSIRLRKRYNISDQYCIDKTKDMFKEVTLEKCTKNLKKINLKITSLGIKI